MLLLFWFLLFVSGTCLLLLMPSLWGKQIYDTFRGKKAVQCPETGAPAFVRLNALRAAVTGLGGRPTLRVNTCSRWPMKSDCAQGCLPDAVQSQAEIFSSDNRETIPHVPVLLSAALSWLLGMAWHSQFVFRDKWAAAFGLSPQRVHDMVWSWKPHLLTVAACLAFAYLVALPLQWFGKRTVWRGLLGALWIWVVVMMATLLLVESWFSQATLIYEGIYTLIAAVLTGVIVGGMPRQLLSSEFE